MSRICIFHGGCIGCTRQQRLGTTEGCCGCQYFDADWDKPDLSERLTDDIDAEMERERLKKLHEDPVDPETERERVRRLYDDPEAERERVRKLCEDLKATRDALLGDAGKDADPSPAHPYMKVVRPGVPPSERRRGWVGKEITCSQCGQIVVLDSGAVSSSHYIVRPYFGGDQFWRCTYCDHHISLRA